MRAKRDCTSWSLEYNARKKLISEKLHEVEEMEQKLGVDGGEAKGKLVALDDSVNTEYQREVAEVEAEYAQPYKR